MSTTIDFKHPLESANFIADVADHVIIKENGIEKCAEEVLGRIANGSLSLNLKLYKDAGEHPVSGNRSSVEWVFFTSALNFSFWNDERQPQYNVTYKVLHTTT